MVPYLGDLDNLQLSNPFALGMGTGVGRLQSFAGYNYIDIKSPLGQSLFQRDPAYYKYYRSPAVRAVFEPPLKPAEGSSIWFYTSNLPPTYSDTRIKGRMRGAIVPAVGVPDKDGKKPLDKVDEGIRFADAALPQGDPASAGIVAADGTVPTPVGGAVPAAAPGFAGGMGGVLSPATTTTGGGGTGGGAGIPGFGGAGGLSGLGGGSGGGLGGGTTGTGTTGTTGTTTGTTNTNTNNVNVHQQQQQQQQQKQQQQQQQQQQQNNNNNVVPEPAAVVAALLGLPAVYLFARRKRKPAESARAS